MKTYRCVFVTGLVILSFWAIPVTGQDLGGLESLVTGTTLNNSPGTMLLLLLKGIGLTAEQKLQVKEILVTHRGKLETLFQELQEANAVLANTLLTPETINAAEVTPLAERVSQIREQLLHEGLTVVLEMRQVLTPEQRAKMPRLRDQLRTFREVLSEPSE